MQVLIALTLGCVLAFHILRQVVRRQLIASNSAPQPQLPRAEASVLTSDPLKTEAGGANVAACDSNSIPLATLDNPLDDLLVNRRGVGDRDRMRRLLDTMSGPGICTTCRS